MRYIILFILVTITLTTSTAQVIEAESGIGIGTQVAKQLSGYTGTGYVTGFDAAGDKITLSVTATAGIYNVYVRYASTSGDKFNFVFVNGLNLGNVAFPLSSSFKETKVGKVYLQKGVNTIAIVKDWGYVEIDNIRLESSTASDIHHIETDLVTPSASAKADSLYNFIADVYGKVILSGQYGGDVELNKIKSISGKLPVIRGFDLIEYSPSRVAHGSSSTEIEKAIEWSKQRGIVTFAWHWNAPKDLIDQPGKEWWRGFYTDATTFDVTKAMNDETSDEYKLIIHDIDSIAVQLKRLQVANIPVLWRPLHEAEGKWFWWGAKGAEPCKWLYKLLFNRLVNYHAINNLIWVWTSTDASTALDWYPGDAYVDIVGADIYLPAGTYSSSFITFDNLVANYGGKKIITLSENGPIPDPDKLFQEGAAWSWFSTWSGSFITDGNSNSTSHIKAVYQNDYVITLDEIDSIDSIIIKLEKKKDEEGDGTVVTEIDNMISASVIYPNPTRNKLILEIRNSVKTSIIIYNAQGEIEFVERSKNERGIEFNFDDKAAGLYLLKVITSSSTKVFKIIKI